MQLETSHQQITHIRTYTHTHTLDPLGRGESRAMARWWRTESVCLWEHTQHTANVELIVKRWMIKNERKEYMKERKKNGYKF